MSDMVDDEYLRMYALHKGDTQMLAGHARLWGVAEGGAGALPVLSCTAEAWKGPQSSGPLRWLVVRSAVLGGYTVYMSRSSGWRGGKFIEMFASCH